MNYHVKVTLRFVLTLFCCAFLFNFLWESLHGAFLYESIGALSSKAYVSLILYATFVDALLIVVMYGLTAFIFKDSSWMERKERFPWILFIFTGFLFAIWIEVRAIFIFHSWKYNSLMLTIFGIGVSPLIQLVITGIVAIVIAHKISS